MFKQALEDKSAVDIENDRASLGNLTPQVLRILRDSTRGRLMAGMELSRMIDFRKATARPYSSMIQRNTLKEVRRAPSRLSFVAGAIYLSDL